MIIVPSNVGKAIPEFKFTKSFSPSLYGGPVMIGSTCYLIDNDSWSGYKVSSINPDTGRITRKLSGNLSIYGFNSPQVIGTTAYGWAYGPNYYGGNFVCYDSVANTYTSTAWSSDTYVYYDDFIISSNGLWGYARRSGNSINPLRLTFSSAGSALQSYSQFSMSPGNSQFNNFCLVENDTKLYVGCGAVASKNNQSCIAVWDTASNTFSKFIAPTSTSIVWSPQNYIKLDAHTLMITAYDVSNNYEYGYVLVNTITDTVGNFVATPGRYLGLNERNTVKIGNKLYFGSSDWMSGSRYNNGLSYFDLETREIVKQKVFQSEYINYGTGPGITYDSTKGIIYLNYRAIGYNAVTAMMSLDAPDPSTATSLLHFEGTDDPIATSMVDVVDYGPDGGGWQIQGTPHYSTSQYKFGTSSMDCSNGCIRTSEKFYMGSNPFTVECWIRPTGTASTTGNFMALRTTGGNYGPFNIFQNGSSLTLQYANAALNAWQPFQTAGTLVANAWHHVAVCGDGTKIRVFLNGNQIISVDQPAWDATNPMPLGVGGYDTYYFQGFLDEFRMSYNKALYTTNFTPPTAAFT